MRSSNGGLLTIRFLVEQVETAYETTLQDEYNPATWAKLVQSLKEHEIANARPLYEYVLSRFPTASAFWKQYADCEISAGNMDQARDIFSRCLLLCLDTNLWRSYLKFMKLSNAEHSAESIHELKVAFEFLLDNIGDDINAGPLWLEYIQFLQREDNSALLFAAETPEMESSAQMTAIRRAYQAAVIIPSYSLEHLWREYEQFENSVSKQLAKPLLNELQPKHAMARSVYRERRKKLEGIDFEYLAIPPGHNKALFAKEKQQANAWKQLRSWEKSNPQGLEPAQFEKRVNLCFDQSLMYLYRDPEVWFEYYQWYIHRGAKKEALDVLSRAQAALPDCILFHFQAAELLYSEGENAAARKVFEVLIDRLIKSCADGVVCEAPDGKNKLSLCWVQYMKLVRKMEGQAAARKIFMRARKCAHVTHHIYSASALLEYNVDKNTQVARNIFELGLKKHLAEPEYVCSYVDFLEGLNDDRNARALFERALPVVPEPALSKFWDRYVNFEETFGFKKSIEAVKIRRNAALHGEETPPNSEIVRLTKRFGYGDLYPCTETQLYHLVRTHQSTFLEQGFDVSVLRRLGVDPLAQISQAQKASTTVKSEILPAQPSSAATAVAESAYRALVEFTKMLPAIHAVKPPFPPVDLVINILSSGDDHKRELNASGKGENRKRKATDTMENSKPAKASAPNHRPPPNDIFRMRQKAQQQ